MYILIGLEHSLTTTVLEGGPKLPCPLTIAQVQILRSVHRSVHPVSPESTTSNMSPEDLHSSCLSIKPTAVNTAIAEEEKVPLAAQDLESGLKHNHDMIEVSMTPSITKWATLQYISMNLAILFGSCFAIIPLLSHLAVLNLFNLTGSQHFKEQYFDCVYLAVLGAAQAIFIYLFRTRYNGNNTVRQALLAALGMVSQMLCSLIMSSILLRLAYLFFRSVVLVLMGVVGWDVYIDLSCDLFASCHTINLG